MLGRSEMRRSLSGAERALLIGILGECRIAGAGELASQVASVEVIGGIPTFLDLSVDPSSARAGVDDGPLEVRAFVRNDQGDFVGEVLIWVKSGYLSAVEFAWVTDDMPERLPDIGHVAVKR